jgi:hypothetical protein
MAKSCEDMEDIIRILIDMFDNMNVDFNTVMLKVRDKHYCLFCMQHYRRCKCDFANVAISSDSDGDSSQHSTEDEDYTSSESDNGTHSETESESESGSDNKSHSDFSESESAKSSESESENSSESEKSKTNSEESSESGSEDDKIINKIISNSTLKKVVLDDPATTSESEEEL